MKDILKRLVKTLAKRMLQRYRPLVIGITGSVGKTTTKEAVFAVVSRFKKTRKSEGNFNTELYIPLTVIGVNPRFITGNVIGSSFKFAVIMLKAFWRTFGPAQKDYPEALVLELAADHPGDIEYLVDIVQPRIGIITAIGSIPVHVEFYESPQEVALHKSILIKELPASGLAILNADDPIVSEMRRISPAPVVTFGLSEGASIRASDIFYAVSNQTKALSGLSFKVSDGHSSVEMNIPSLMAPHQVYCILPAVAIGLHFGQHLVDIAQVLETLSMPQGRTRLIEGQNDTTIIDDSYNSSPLAAMAALDLLQEVGTHAVRFGITSRRVAILGDMKELGAFEERAHRDLGHFATGKADVIIGIGPAAKYITEEAAKTLTSKRVMHYETTADALSNIKTIISPHDVVLIKGSQSMRMEKIVKALMAHPEKAKELLCRQYGKWLAR